MSKITQQKKQKKKAAVKPVLGSRVPNGLIASFDTRDFREYWLVDVDNMPKVMEFLNRFDVKPTILHQKKLTPRFIYNPHSTSGEIAEVIGVFTKPHTDDLFIVTGSECSMWDFNGQFQPEALSIAAVQHLVLNGTYGAETYGAALLKCLNTLIPEPPQDITGPCEPC